VEKTRLEKAKELALAHGYDWEQTEKAVQRAWVKKAKEAGASDVCPKCQDRGYIEQEHGLFRECCDCEKGQALRAEVFEESGKIPPETPDVVAEEVEPQDVVEVKDDSDSGTGQPDNITGSGDTGKPKCTQKPKAKKKARAKSG